MSTDAILLSHMEQTESTSYPFWAIAVKGGIAARAIFLDGPWFNREDAEAFLRAYSYNYPKTAFVYCFSGNKSQHLREMYDNARALATPSPEDVKEDVPVTPYKDDPQ